MIARTVLIQNPWFVGPSIGLLAAAVSVGMAFNGDVTLLAVLAATAVAGGLVVASRIQRYWLSGLGVVLIGYAVLGKGFAYIGLPPLFVGDVMLAGGLFAVAIGGGMRFAVRSPLVWCWALFALVGLVRTVPFVGVYGLDAVRDAVVWGYGLVAVVLAACLVRTGQIARVPALYAAVLPWFLLWLPCAILIQTVAGSMLPRLPLSGMPILNIKSGDAAVHLAGASSFLLIGLHELTSRQASVPSRRWKEWVLWVLWLAGVGLAGSASRSGLLSVLAASLVVLVLRPRSLGRLKKAALIVVTILVLSFSFDLEFNLGVKSGRTIGPSQVISNVQSALGIGPDAEDEALQGTRNWRLQWWNAIVDYTVFGEHFWGGKGFGINLADDDGFQGTAWEGLLRNPHNVHLTILGRAGVPGLTLWLLLQGSFGVGLVRAYARARRLQQHWWAAVDLWVLAYWTAFLVNASFDVFLEGPQAGIWFWSLFGFGLVLLEQQKRWTSAGHPVGETESPIRAGEATAVNLRHR